MLHHVMFPNLVVAAAVLRLSSTLFGPPEGPESRRSQPACAGNSRCARESVVFNLISKVTSSSVFGRSLISFKRRLDGTVLSAEWRSVVELICPQPGNVVTK